jgi:O-antigen ligase
MPGVALVGLFSMFGIEQWAQANSAYYGQNSTLINILFVALVLVSLSIRVLRQKPSSEPYPLACALVILLYGYAFISTVWTSNAVDTGEIWIKAAPYLAVNLIMAPLLVAKPEDVTKIFRYQVFIGGLFAALIIFGSEYAGRRIVLEEIEGKGGNPLAVAQMAGVTVICCVMIKSKSRVELLMKITIACICVFAIVMSGSRGQLIGLAIAILAGYPMVYSLRNPKVLVASSLGAILFLYLVSVGLDTYWGDSNRWSGEGMVSDYDLRINNSGRLLSAWFQNPAAIVFGLGNSSSYDLSIIGIYPHNIPVEVLGEEGILGALIYLWILAIVAREAIYVIRRKNGQRDENAAFAILFGIVSYLFLLSLKQGSFLTVSQFFMAAMLFAKIVAVTRARDRLKETN